MFATRVWSANIEFGWFLDDPSLLPQSLKLGSLVRVYRFFGKKLSKGGDSVDSMVGYFGGQMGICVRLSVGAP